MTPFDMNYSQDVLFSADIAGMSRIAAPFAPSPRLQTHAARPASVQLGQDGSNPAALRHAIAAERPPASRVERLMQALDAHSMGSTISVVLAYMAILNAI